MKKPALFTALWFIVMGFVGFIGWLVGLLAWAS